MREGVRPSPKGKHNPDIYDGQCKRKGTRLWQNSRKQCKNNLKYHKNNQAYSNPFEKIHSFLSILLLWCTGISAVA